MRVNDFVVSDLLENLDPQDRISPILAQYERIAEDINLKQAVELFVETADTNEAKELSIFCRKFTVPLRQALKKKGWLQGKPNAKRSQILHCFSRSRIVAMWGIPILVIILPTLWESHV